MMETVTIGLPISQLPPLGERTLSGNDYFVISKARTKNKYDTLRCDISAITGAISSDIYQYTINNLPPQIDGNISDLSVRLTKIEGRVPKQTYDAGNELADKNFVNSSIQTNTAEFRGTYDYLSALYEITADSNDYAYVTEKTDDGTISSYARYKWNGLSSDWMFEYKINNSGFTAVQWSAINSGITEELVSKISGDGEIITTDHLDGNTICYDKDDKKVKLGDSVLLSIDNCVKNADIKCENWTFYMKDGSSKTFPVILSCN